jgi:hypothetical protein
MLKTNNIQENVLQKIHARAISMHSRAYFAFRTAAVSLTALSVLALSLFLVSFIFFSINASGTGFLLEFKEQGFMAFVSLFPWTIFLWVLILLIALEVLLRYFKFSYRVPLLRTFLWVVIISIAGSILISFTPLHSLLLSEADSDNLPVIGPLYTQIHNSHQEQGVYRGIVTSIATSSFVISHADTDRDSDEGSWIIQPPSGFNLSTLSMGEKVYIAGRLQNNIVYAYGIHRISPKTK